MRADKPVAKTLLIAAILVVLTLSLGGTGASKAVDRGATYENLKLFTDVLAIIQNQYVDETEPRDVIQGAVRGMLRGLDPHSSYMDPESYREMQVETSGSFGGLGIEITIRDDQLTVVSPIEGTPAARAGIQAADRIVRIEGLATKDMTLPDRCIHYGFPDLFAAYMSVYRIVQTPQYVAIQMEKIHDTRIIPLDGRPHLSSSMHQYLGDSRGRWEGDTLVVETTNFHPNGNPMGGYFTLSDKDLRLIERFRRTAADTLEYTFTVDNPTMWTKPWTAVIYWKASKSEVFEYACHEGNYSLRGMLAGARADEVRSR